MKNRLTSLRSAVIISSVLVIPLMILELVNRRRFHEGFPVALFALLWLLPAVFTLILIPIIRRVRAENGITAKPFSLFLRVALLAFIAWVWVFVVVDQMPCFLGVPNCD